MVYPFVKNWDDINDKKIKFQERRQRIFMRGVKIGAKKGGPAMFAMQVFEMKDKKKVPGAGSTETAKTGDETVGLTSDQNA